MLWAAAAFDILPMLLTKYYDQQTAAPFARLLHLRTPLPLLRPCRVALDEQRRQRARLSRLDEPSDQPGLGRIVAISGSSMQELTHIKERKFQSYLDPPFQRDQQSSAL